MQLKKLLGHEGINFRRKLNLGFLRGRTCGLPNIITWGTILGGNLMWILLARVEKVFGS